MPAHCRDRPDLVAVGQAIDDLGMLVDEQWDVVGILQAEIAHAVEMDLGLHDHVPDPRVAADARDGIVKALVEVIELFGHPVAVGALL